MNVTNFYSVGHLLIGCIVIGWLVVLLLYTVDNDFDQFIIAM